MKSDCLAPLMYSDSGAVYTDPSELSGMLYRKSMELVDTGVVNVTYWPEPLPARVTALRPTASSASWPWV